MNRRGFLGYLGAAAALATCAQSVPAFAETPRPMPEPSPAPTAPNEQPDALEFDDFGQYGQMIERVTNGRCTGYLTRAEDRPCIYGVITDPWTLRSRQFEVTLPQNSMRPSHVRNLVMRQIKYRTAKSLEELGVRLGRTLGY